MVHRIAAVCISRFQKHSTMTEFSINFQIYQLTFKFFLKCQMTDNQHHTNKIAIDLNLLHLAHTQIHIDK
jgi:hypothetical protein